MCVVIKIFQRFIFHFLGTVYYIILNIIGSFVLDIFFYNAFIHSTNIEHVWHIAVFIILITTGNKKNE